MVKITESSTYEIVGGSSHNSITDAMEHAVNKALESIGTEVVINAKIKITSR